MQATTPGPAPGLALTDAAAPPPDQAPSDQSQFDQLMCAAAFVAIAREGWRGWSPAAAAREAGLDLAQARTRFPDRWSVLAALGAAADAQALLLPQPHGPVPAQERLFDMLMRRIDVLQTHRDGVKTLLAALPTDPATALRLTASTLSSLRWLMDAAGLSASGPLGALRVQGLLAVWLWTLRTWQSDETADLAATMATLDTALTRAAQLARSLPGAPAAPLPDFGPTEAERANPGPADPSLAEDTLIDEL